MNSMPGLLLCYSFNLCMYLFSLSSMGEILHKKYIKQHKTDPLAMAWERIAVLHTADRYEYTDSIKTSRTSVRREKQPRRELGEMYARTRPNGRTVNINVHPNKSPPSPLAPLRSQPQ